MIVILVAVDSDIKTRMARTTNGTALTRPGYRFKDNEHSNGIVSYLIRIKFMFSGKKANLQQRMNLNLFKCFFCLITCEQFMLFKSLGKLFTRREVILGSVLFHRQTNININRNN